VELCLLALSIHPDSYHHIRIVSGNSHQEVLANLKKMQVIQTMKENFNE
jgi:hypothetical protein